jgi:hypothetical protein
MIRHLREFRTDSNLPVAAAQIQLRYLLRLAAFDGLLRLLQTVAKEAGRQGIGWASLPCGEFLPTRDAALIRET